MQSKNYLDIEKNPATGNYLKPEQLKDFVNLLSLVQQKILDVALNKKDKNALINDDIPLLRFILAEIFLQLKNHSNKKGKEERIKNFLQNFFDSNVVSSNATHLGTIESIIKDILNDKSLNDEIQKTPKQY